MPLESVEPYLQAEWGKSNDELRCPHCDTKVQINGFDYLDEDRPQECIWQCDECEKKFAIDVIVTRKYQTATKWT